LPVRGGLVAAPDRQGTALAPYFPDARLPPKATVESSPSRGRSVRLPGLVAHRGWAAKFPENTIAALSAALEAGAERLEVDVQLSSDGRPVLFHDRTLERMCDAAGAVHQRSLADLEALRCAEKGRFGEQFASERIARLEGLVALLAKHPRASAFVEIKRASIEAFGAERILETVLPLLEPVRARVALISFSLPFLAAARKRTSLPLGAVFDAWSERAEPEARAIETEWVFCDVEGLPAAAPLEAGKARIAVYEVADPALAVELAARGVDLVETFAIGDMLAALRGIEAKRR